MYRIEITAGTLAELAGKVLALATQLNETVPEAPRYVGLLIGDAEPTPPEIVELGNEDTSSKEEVSSGPNDTTPPAGEPVDKETLRSLVLAVVAAKGRETVEEILSTFGLAKASDVAAEQADELVEALKGAL